MKTIYPLMLLGLLAGWLAGCASSSANRLALQSALESKVGIQILHLDWRVTAQGLLVQGQLAGQPDYQGLPGEHLDLQLISPTGQVLAEQNIGFYPSPILLTRGNAGRAAFSNQFALVPPPGSTVRVTVAHHNHPARGGA